METPAQVNLGWGFVFRWSIANLIGDVVSGLIAVSFLGAIVNRFALVIIFLIVGAINGLAQSLVLKNLVGHARYWIIATTAGTAIGALLGSFTDNSAQSTVLAYLVIAVGQWAILRRHVPYASVWVFVLVAWPLIIRPVVSDNQIMLVGLLRIMLMGLVLVLLFRRKYSASQVIGSPA